MKRHKPKGRPIQIHGGKNEKIRLGDKHRAIAARFDADNLSNGVRRGLEFAGDKLDKSGQSRNSS